MPRYPKALIEEVRRLRATGETYGEMRALLGISVPKSTFSDWCKNVTLPDHYQARIDAMNIANLGKAKAVAVAMNKIKKEEFFARVLKINTPVAEKVSDKETAKIALAMLCLGEASKYKPGSSSFSLGNSDPRIIILFIKFLKQCFDFNIEKVRCTVQCRADQDIPALEEYWQRVTHIPKRYFYKAQVDPRTVGKPTLKLDYKGVLKVSYFSRKIQLELESLADLIYNRVLLGP